MHFVWTWLSDWLPGFVSSSVERFWPNGNHSIKTVRKAKEYFLHHIPRLMLYILMCAGMERIKMHFSASFYFYQHICLKILSAVLFYFCLAIEHLKENLLLNDLYLASGLFMWYATSIGVSCCYFLWRNFSASSGSTLCHGKINHDKTKKKKINNNFLIVKSQRC